MLVSIALTAATVCTVFACTKCSMARDPRQDLLGWDRDIAEQYCSETEMLRILSETRPRWDVSTSQDHLEIETSWLRPRPCNDDNNAAVVVVVAADDGDGCTMLIVVGLIHISSWIHWAAVTKRTWTWMLSMMPTGTQVIVMAANCLKQSRQSWILQFLCTISAHATNFLNQSVNCRDFDHFTVFYLIFWRIFMGIFYCVHAQKCSCLISIYSSDSTFDSVTLIIRTKYFANLKTFSVFFRIIPPEICYLFLVYFGCLLTGVVFGELWFC